MGGLRDGVVETQRDQGGEESRGKDKDIFLIFYIFQCNIALIQGKSGSFIVLMLEKYSTLDRL